MMHEPKRPVLPSAATPGSAADITADILTPKTSDGTIRGTLMMKAQSLASLLAADRKQAELSHPWFSSDLDDGALDQFALEQPDPALLLTAGVAVIAACEVLMLFVLLS